MDGLKSIRTEKGLTLKQVSEGTGLSVQALSHYERGERFPNKEVLEKLSAFFNCTIDNLMRSKEA